MHLHPIGFKILVHKLGGKHDQSVRDIKSIRSGKKKRIHIY